MVARSIQEIPANTGVDCAAMPIEFAERYTLVTGASSGLGTEFARQIAAEGGNLVLTARSETKLARLADELAENHNVTVKVVPGDLSSPRGARDVAKAVDALGVSIEHLVNNAGFGSFGPVATANETEQAGMVRVNCEALVYMSRYFLPGMLQKKSGGILHIASIAGFQPIPFMATYAATKAFVISFSTALAAEVEGEDVTISAICPGPVPTGFGARAGSPQKSPHSVLRITADVCVRESLAAYRRGATVFVPGTKTRLSAAGLRLLPRAALLRATGRFLRKRYSRAGVES
jgi:short-subunit dehydrogenase